MNILRRMKGVSRAIIENSTDLKLEDSKDWSKKLLSWLRELENYLEEIRRTWQPPIAPTPTQKPGIKPCWQWANTVYEWGMKTLPPEKRNLRDIYEAAKARRTAGGGDVPRDRLPLTAKTFAHYVRQFRKAKGLESHRLMRRSGRA